MQALGSQGSLAFCTCEMDLCNARSIFEQNMQSIALSSSSNFSSNIDTGLGLDPQISFINGALAAEASGSQSTALLNNNNTPTLQQRTFGPSPAVAARFSNSTNAALFGQAPVDFIQQQQQAVNFPDQLGGAPGFPAPGPFPSVSSGFEQPGPVIVDHSLDRAQSALIAIDNDGPSNTQAKLPSVTSPTNSQQQNFWNPHTGRSPPGSIPPSNSQRTSKWPSPTQRATTGSIKPQSRVQSPNINGTAMGERLVCQVCGEGDLDDARPECRESHPMDCSTQHPPGTRLFCVTRDTVLANSTSEAEQHSFAHGCYFVGKHAIEKLCLSESALREEYGQSVAEGCYMTQEGKVNYCVCGISNCNQESISAQLHRNPPIDIERQQVQQQRAPSSFTTLHASGTGQISLKVCTHLTTSTNDESNCFQIQGSTFCYICGESDLNEARDCAQQYEYDCSLQ